jgi:hypothetical protein
MSSLFSHIFAPKLDYTLSKIPSTKSIHSQVEQKQDNWRGTIQSVQECDDSSVTMQTIVQPSIGVCIGEEVSHPE